MSAYKTYYEERAKALDSIIDKFKLASTFEDFVGNVFSPSQQGTIIQGEAKVQSLCKPIFLTIVSLLQN